ncbi:MAG: sulfite exporter TauE/SafE family protein [Syntrophobacter sp.]
MSSLIVGLLAGIFGGLVGLGGGVVMIPLMVDFLKMSQHRAHGTSLVAVVFTGIAGAVNYYTHGNVFVTEAALLALTAIFMARFGARFANTLPEWKLKRSFGGFLICVSILMLLKPYIPHLESFFPSQGSRIIILLVTGVFTGFLSGMMGVGGGTIMVPAMVLLLGFTQQAANGTSLLTMIPAGAAGAWTHYKFQNVQTNLLMGLIPGILVGGFLGGEIANNMPELYLRLVFAAVLIWTGLRYLRACPPKTAPKPASEALALSGQGKEN